MEVPNSLRGKVPTPNLAIMRNLALPSTTSPSSSSPEKDSDEDSLNQQYERASAFRSTMEDIKKRLKTKRGYESAVQDLLGQIDSELNFENKRVFYDCLNIISHRVGKPGFSASVAKPLFDAAWSKNSIFTPGFRKNIGDWKNTIDSLVSNPSSITPSVERTDGRFGSRKTTTTPKKRSGVDYNLAHLVLLRQFVENFSDSDDDSDDLVSVNNSQLSNLLAPSPFRTNSNSEIPYPFAYEVTDLPAPMAIMSIKHSPNPITVNYSFFLTDKHIGRCQGTAKIMICVYAAGTHHKTAAEYPKSVLYEINGEDVPNTPDGTNKYFTGIDVTGKCHVGKNSLTIKTFNCVCSYEFSVRIVDIKSLEHIAKDITQNKIIDYTRSRQRVISSFNTGGDIVQLSSRVSLRCPLSQARIAVPARGNECRHIQCFDLDTYLTLNKNNPKFKCPVCSRSVSTSELVIDSFFKSLLEDSSLQNTDEVEILPDGKWKAPESRGKRKSPFEAETPTKRQYIIAENAPSPIQKPQTKPLTPVKIEIIDLT